MVQLQRIPSSWVSWDVSRPWTSKAWVCCTDYTESCQGRGFGRLGAAIPLPADLGATVAFVLCGIFCWLSQTEICWCNSGGRPEGGDCLKGKGMECRKNNKMKTLQLFWKWLAILNALVWIQNDLLRGRVSLNCIQKSYLPLGEYPCFYAH